MNRNSITGGRPSGSERTLLRDHYSSFVNKKGSENGNCWQTQGNIIVDVHTEMGRCMLRQSGGNPELANLNSKE